ncbi:hypothetical protein BU16DRAFT_505359 [Lophium mytilinum]|uniref:GH64 domain-containing protein n=1 Tax=Lophium mytilinum TaxID=390894 RepID=A0A6A6R261_9PEZI|nr:hypothetical protein BU16DRAFT_505359 [Lophium mytilinum]
MRAFATLAFATAASLIGQALAAPISGRLISRSTGIVVTPGTVDDVIITADNTVNGTVYTGHNGTVTAPRIQATEKLSFALVNNFDGAQINAYVTGRDASDNIVMLQADGSWYFPNPQGSTTPVAITGNVNISLGAKGSTTNIQLPGYISSARVYFAEGNLQFFVVAIDSNGGAGLVEPAANNPSDPNAGVNWGFVELTNNDGGLYANISYVDFVGLVLSMSMIAGDGSVQTVKGLQAGAASSICNDLTAVAGQDGQPWDQLCMKDSSGKLLRVLAPTKYLDLAPDAFSTYFTDYINTVWSTYSTKDLTINTQSTSGNVACRTSGDVLNCAGDNRSYAKPVPKDIFGCDSGTFYIDRANDNAIHYAVAPRLCAAFARTTLLLSGGDVQPSLDSGSYYTTAPTHRYSQYVHKYETDNKGYAFSYDDVNPSGENAAGVVSDANPQLLTIYVGGYAG